MFILKLAVQNCTGEVPPVKTLRVGELVAVRLVGPMVSDSG
jgi:hypothetical protein